MEAAYLRILGWVPDWVQIKKSLRDNWKQPSLVSTPVLEYNNFCLSVVMVHLN